MAIAPMGCQIYAPLIICARYGLYYLRFMEKLLDTLTHFIKVEHVMCHKPGIWNAIWSDMYVESTFMHTVMSLMDLQGFI